VDITKELPTVLSFCSGYGGLERGLDLAGFEHRTVAYVEIEAYAIANLANKMEGGKLLPAPIWSNLKTLPVQPFREKIDLVTGGYPCQPFSAAGRRLGEEDPRHLWPYIRRHIESIRPVRCFFENVEGHITLGLREVISDLESLGYKTAFGIFSAAEVGAPHQRKRVYILADSNGAGQQAQWDESRPERQTPATCESSELADSKGIGVQRLRPSGIEKSDTHGEEELPLRESKRPRDAQWEAESSLGGGFDGPASWVDGTWEMGVERVTAGCPDRIDRIRLLGNGIVPQTAAKAWVTLQEKIKQ